MSSPLTTELHVTGMTCNNCARKVTDAAQKIPGVHSVSVSVATERASVRWNSAGAKNAASVIAAISQAGFSARELAAGNSGNESRQNRWNWPLIAGLTVTILLMMGEWAFHVMMERWFQWLSFGLATIVQVYCGAQFYCGAWRQLKAGQSNMDTLVALGSTTAFGFSCWVLFSGAAGHVYFMEAAAIISLVSFGHWLEARVSDKASGALKSLMTLAPPTARKLLPHPNPLPLGEGTALFTLRKPAASDSVPALKRILPLPAGEGRGEGEISLRTFSFSKPETGNQKSETETEVPVSTLQIGDRIALRPGDRVPVDGVVIEGASAVDEAMLTGESNPADKKPGGELFAGTVNLNGRLILRVTATGESTALAHIIAAVQRAQTSRADIQRLGDRISNVFVPVIVAIALAAGVFWFFHSGAERAFVIASGILIIACPCAMGLATPAAIMAGANAAARRGILIRDGVALEKAGKITAVIFDKTGTLTVGKPEVAASISFLPHPNPLPLGEGIAIASSLKPNAPDSNPALKQLLPLPAGEGRGEGEHIAHIAGALARHSTHPISQAIAKVSADKIEVADWKEIRGAGVEGKFSTLNSQPSTVRLGSLNWLRERGVDLAAGETFIAEWSGQGATIVGLAGGKELLALFAVRDAVKANAKQVVEQLQRQGLKIYLLTGDNSLTATSIAKQVGIAPENVFAEVRPEEKAEFVKKLQAGSGTGILPVSSETHRQDACATERVAFVGDGINDAPALTQADLGIAVSRASDVAREAADLILLKSEIEAVPEAIGLARATLRTIRQNLFWAFFYNALGVPLAAMGFISPVLCAAAMGVSDLIVIGNALRLLRWRQR
jgi:Cu+-exporting ATPase